MENSELFVAKFSQARTFLDAPLYGVYVILGMLLCHEFNPRVDYITRSFCFDFDDQNVYLQASFESENRPLLSHTS